MQCYSFDKVVIWGHKLHSHTHSYIHYGFYKAFLYLGYPTYWFDEYDDVSGFDFSNSLFLTANQASEEMPIRDDCKYILHNTDDIQLRASQFMKIQTYTRDVSLRPGYIKIAPCIYYDRGGKVLYMPWATDLLPFEIDEIKKNVSLSPGLRKVYWVGTMSKEGEYSNFGELNPFISACRENGIEFVYYGIYTNAIKLIGMDENRQLIAASYMAPAIVGQWQKEQGYIPCRIFKNISYGKIGITNSDVVYELFEKKIVYNSDTYQLFYDAQKAMETMTIDDLYELMDFVKERHTYLNRIDLMLKALNGVL